MVWSEMVKTAKCWHLLVLSAPRNDLFDRLQCNLTESSAQCRYPQFGSSILLPVWHCLQRDEYYVSGY